MKFFYQPHPCIKPIIKDMIDCKRYSSHLTDYTLYSIPIELMIQLPYTRTLERIDKERFDGELAKRGIWQVDLIIKYILQFDLNDARSDFGDRSWLSRINVSVYQLNGRKVEPRTILINNLEYYYTEKFLRAKQQDDFTNIGDLDEFRWCSIVKVLDDDNADELEQERLQTLGCY